MHIDIFSDTVCPWCRIGKANLDKALEQVDEPVTIRWRTFLLDPTMPEEGRDFRDKMSMFGSAEQLQQMFAQTAEAGKRAGVDFDFDKISMSPSTFLSHRLIHIAPEEQQLALAEAIMSAYFEEGADIGKLDVLLSIAGGLGLDEAELRKKLDHGDGKSELAQDVSASQHFGIRSVPFFIIDQRVGVSGAQPPDVFLQAFTQAKEAIQDSTKD